MRITGTSLPFFHPAMLLATWFGAGRLPAAPGTWGSLAALPFAWGMAMLAGPSILFAAALAALLAGIWASEAVTRASGVKDPGEIVIDEVAGQWLALAFVPLDPVAYALGFALFRIFDIFKPWPANWIDRSVSGGPGIMLDDIVAGAYAGILLYFLLPYLP
ncbi:MAG: phosphatidylglycerophosphatase A [Proteobacteria bacterium]|jgi:phosphatidylglycerophosphatase A|nr:phosphatidylglycerophosphatase A [Pseudomonadota bacterium]